MQAVATDTIQRSADALPSFVAIPAKNEAAELAGCLAALAAQRGRLPDGVVLCLNDCTDDSAGIVRRMAVDLPFPVHTLGVALPPAQSCAGLARRIAMEHAAELAGAGGVLLTTDADSRVPPDWLAANIGAIARGAEAVAGRADIEPIGARLIPSHLHAIDARECAYAELLDEIRWLLDPDPADPWPRHDEHCGASIAVTVAAYRRAGGMPAVRLAEDRAFFARLRQVDASIRHAPEIRVVVSARLHGRAPGGMADTMRRRMVRVDPHLDERLEPAHDAFRRARLRLVLRRLWQAGGATPVELQTLAARLRLPVGALAAKLRIDAASPWFGAAWAWVEQHSPVLQPRRVPLVRLQSETSHAMRIRDRLRHAAGQADMLLPVAAE